MTKGYTEARTKAKDPSIVAVKNFPRVNHESQSKCGWNGCDMMIDNSSAGIQGHILKVHYTDTTVPSKSTGCHWGSCDGALYSGGASFVKHIRGTHLRLEDLICPYCQAIIANGISPSRKHMQKNHPEIKI